MATSTPATTLTTTLTTLVLARHGQAAYEADTWQPDGGSLTDLGREQAAALGDRLAGRGITHVWTSTLARAVQTGEIAAARLGVPVTTRQGLCELAVGDHAGVPLDEDPFAPTYAAWLAGDLDARVAGGDSGRELVDRMTAVLEEVAARHRGGTVLVVSHGGVLRLTVPLWARMEIEPQRTANGATIEVVVGDDGPACVSWEAP